MGIGTGNFTGAPDHDEFAKVLSLMSSFHSQDIDVIRAGINDLSLLVEESSNKKSLMEFLFQDAEIIYDQKTQPRGIMSTLAKMVASKNSQTADDEKACVIVDEADSLQVLICFLLMALGHGNKFGIRLFRTVMSEIKSLLTQLKTPSGSELPLISKEMIQDIMNLPLVEKVLKTVPQFKTLAIISMEYVLAEVDSFSYPPALLIVNTRNRKHPEGWVNQSQVFMHELGHVFQFLMTDSVDGYPEGFAALADSMAVRGDKFASFKTEDQQEIFADFFAVACCAGTAFSKENIHHESFLEENIPLIRDYFYGLLA